MPTKYFLFIFSAVIINAHIFCQEWTARYNGVSPLKYDQANDIKVDASGNVYVTGASYDTTLENGDITTVKYNSAGIQQWAVKYNNAPVNGLDIGYSITIDNSGNVYITGESEFITSPASLLNIVTIKYNSAGVQQWVARTADTVLFLSGNRPYITLDASGNIYTGYTSRNNFTIVKYTQNGVQQWVQRYGVHPTYSYLRAMTADASGNIYAAGYVIIQLNSSQDYLTVKYNSSGVKQWEAKYNSAVDGAEFLRAMTIDDAGNVYVTGSSASGGGLDEIATVKYNSSGAQQWVQKYKRSGYDGHDAEGIAVDLSGNVYVCGISGDQDLFDGDYVILKYNSAGTQQWVSFYNGPGNSLDFPFSISIDALGNSYVTGLSAGSGSGYDYATLKYNSSGAQQWVQRYNGSANGEDIPFGLVLDNNGFVYVTGESEGEGTSSDFLTIKYAQSIGIQQISSEVPGAYFLAQNYPNPFNPVTNIRFSIPKAGMVTIKIYDALGSEIAAPVNQFLNAGTFNFDFDARSLTSGVYFYRLNAGQFTDVKKMVLVK